MLGLATSKCHKGMWKRVSRFLARQQDNTPIGHKLGDTPNTRSLCAPRGRGPTRPPSQGTQERRTLGLEPEDALGLSAEGAVPLAVSHAGPLARHAMTQPHPAGVTG